MFIDAVIATIGWTRIENSAVGVVILSLFYISYDTIYSICSTWWELNFVRSGFKLFFLWYVCICVGIQFLGNFFEWPNNIMIILLETVSSVTDILVLRLDQIQQLLKTQRSLENHLQYLSDSFFYIFICVWSQLSHSFGSRRTFQQKVSVGWLHCFQLPGSQTQWIRSSLVVAQTMSETQSVHCVKLVTKFTDMEQK